jgi:menaquinol-cytochrome c reductase iron-sulfur subunit
MTSAPLEKPAVSPPAPEPAPPADSSTEPRRDFLTEILAISFGFICGVVPFAAGLLTFLNPVIRKKPEGGPTYIRVAPLSAVPMDVPQRFAVKADMVDAWTRSPNEPVGAVYLMQKGGGVVACFNAICPHAGCFVNCTGGSHAQFSCPCHESFFSLDGVRGEGSPSPRNLDSLTTRIVDGFVEVEFQNFYTGRPGKDPK